MKNNRYTCFNLLGLITMTTINAAREAWNQLTAKELLFQQLAYEVSLEEAKRKGDQQAIDHLKTLLSLIPA